MTSPERKGKGRRSKDDTGGPDPQGLPVVEPIPKTDADGVTPPVRRMG